MIRLSANLSKKLPLPGVEFSSQQFGAAMEIEVGDGDRPEAIQQRIRELYAMLSNAIDEQLRGAAGDEAPAHQENGYQSSAPPRSRLNGNLPRNGNGHSPANGRTGRATGNGRSVTATEAQCRAIHAICKAKGLDAVAALADYNVSRAEDLHVRDASRLIDELKSRSNTSPTHR